jgi:hypothetical protein
VYFLVVLLRFHLFSLAKLTLSLVQPCQAHAFTCSALPSSRFHLFSLAKLTFSLVQPCQAHAAMSAPLLLSKLFLTSSTRTPR